MRFPLRTAREYPITGSHFEAVAAQRRPKRSVTVMWMSFGKMLAPFLNRDAVRVRLWTIRIFQRRHRSLNLFAHSRGDSNAMQSQVSTVSTVSPDKLMQLGLGFWGAK